MHKQQEIGLSKNKAINVNTVLCNNVLMLRSWQVSDARWYVEARDEEVFAWTTEPRTLTIEETAAAIEQLHERTDSFGFAIVDLKTMEILGNIALVVDRANQRSAEVMYWLAAWGRGRGIASQAVQLLCQWAFSELGLGEVTLQTHCDNRRSQRVAERAGFQRMEDPSVQASQTEKLWFVLTQQNNVS